MGNYNINVFGKFDRFGFTWRLSINNVNISILSKGRKAIWSYIRDEIGYFGKKFIVKLGSKKLKATFILI